MSDDETLTVSALMAYEAGVVNERARIMALLADEATVEALWEFGHEIEWVDDEVGYVCGCDEDGLLYLPTHTDARKHVTRAILVAVRDLIREAP